MPMVRFSSLEDVFFKIVDFGKTLNLIIVWQIQKVFHYDSNFIVRSILNYFKKSENKF